MLQPKGDDFTQIQYVAKNIFKGQEILEQKKVITVEILNGTTIAGLASRNLQELKLVGYRVNKIGNSPKQNYTNTVVYKLSQKNAPEEEKFLASKYNTDIQKNNIPDWAINMAGLDLDFLIILGQDVAE